jgi:hypothetical protein
MKKSELQQLIKEEIQNILQEEDPIQTSFNKKVGMPEPSGVKNTMRPKSIKVKFNPKLKIIYVEVDDEYINKYEGINLIKQYAGLEPSWSNIDKIIEKLKDKKINFEYSEVDYS